MFKTDFQAYKRLVEGGGDYLSKDGYGETPFYRSCKEGLLNHVKFLIGLRGVNIFGKCNGTNSLYAAVFSGNIDIVKILVENGYSASTINQQQVEGCTAFYCACQTSNLDIAQFLLDNGAEIDIPDEDGNTSLHSAVAKGKTGVFNFLLSRGANPLLTNNSGESPFTYADTMKRTQMRKAMKSKIYGESVSAEPAVIPEKDKSVVLCSHCMERLEGVRVLKCSKCLNAAYCNKTCQTAHWKSHKQQCKPYTSDDITW
jgi:ankyrin repeat protein